MDFDNGVVDRNGPVALQADLVGTLGGASGKFYDVDLDLEGRFVGLDGEYITGTTTGVVFVRPDEGPRGVYHDADGTLIAKDD